jgi:hypothetical protein
MRCQPARVDLKDLLHWATAFWTRRVFHALNPLRPASELLASERALCGADRAAVEIDVRRRNHRQTLSMHALNRRLAGLVFDLQALY